MAENNVCENKENAKRLYDERREKYSAASDIVVNADGTVDSVAREIADYFK